MTLSERLLDIITRAGSSLVLLSEKEMSAKSDPKKWSKKEILGHLIDSAYNNHIRIVRASKQENLILDTYDQDLWVKQNNYQERKSSEIIQLWVVVNRHLAMLIDNTAPDIITRETTEHNFHQICMRRVAAGSSTSLEYLIEDYIFHMEHHLTQLY